MRNKIFAVVGVLIIIVAVGTYFLFDINIRQQSQMMGVNILKAKTTIPEGTVIKNINQASKYFEISRTVQNDIVQGAVKVNAIKENKSLKDCFMSTEDEISHEDLKGLVGKKTTVTISKNQQVLSNYLIDDTTEFNENERLFAITTTYKDSVGAEVTNSDYVDVWVYYGKGSPKAGVSEKIIGPLKIFRVKDGSNNEIKDGESSGDKLPQIVIFKLLEDQIALLSQKQHEGTLFLTKWGITPQKL
ncbi:MAG: hypothetical protein PHN69_05905 [Candidatus Pacebacteria bacterium]|nr:hypothetical protein [Candidatus Paceibacterota bacterium]